MSSSENEILKSSHERLYLPKEPLTDGEILYKEIEVLHVGNIKFVGRFGLKKDTCGQFKRLYACDCGCSKKIIKKSCNNLNCPNCYITAIRRLRKVIAIRCKKIIDMKETLGFMNHITFGYSLDDSPVVYTFEQYKKFKRKIVNIIKKCGGAGVLIFHAYRKNESETLMFYSPHFHMVGNMWISPDFYDEYGFICKKIEDIKTGRIVKFRKIEHLKSTIGYLLTHASYYENKKLSVWFGKYSYNKLKKIDIEKIEEFPICEVCQSNLYLVETDDLYLDFYETKGSIVLKGCYLNFRDRNKPLCSREKDYSLSFG